MGVVYEALPQGNFLRCSSPVRSGMCLANSTNSDKSQVLWILFRPEEGAPVSASRPVQSPPGGTGIETIPVCSKQAP